MLLKYFSPTAPRGPRSHCCSQTLATVHQRLQRTTTFFINMHNQYSALSSRSLSAQPGEDCIFSLLFCIIDEWMLCVESCPTPSLWHLAQFALNMRPRRCPHMRLQRSLHLAADRTAGDNSQRTMRNRRERDKAGEGEPEQKKQSHRA
ncbi:hypothetical protein ROHU_027926 [Labeo rohita]|uniref:Uncharacterized protein n=1 Tax=Labeo rohita TaxID=84645 RepID=A0A498M950_LABRO|nr:hypothetical protein ROHU_027926 [Labeo rohita]